MKNIINELNNAENISDELIFKCCDRCIETNDAESGILKLKELVSDCKTLADYVDFFRNVLKLNAEESDNGIILRLGKKKCTCPISDNLNIDKSRLCDCTETHEKKLWSLFFGKDIDVEILESFHRGGNDCVIKIMF